MIDEVNKMNRLAKENAPDSELRYRRLFEAARDGILVLDAESRKIIDANSAIIELSGCPRNEIIGKELAEIGLFETKDEYENAFQALREKAALRYEDWRIETKTGQQREIELLANLYAEGERQMIQCSVRDISERKRAVAERERLAQTVTRLAHIASKAARLGGWTIELPDRKLSWSDENCAIHEVPPGYQPTLEEGIGYYPEDYREKVVRYVEACAQDGTPYDFEMPKYTAKGRLIWVRSIGEAVRDGEGKIIRLQGAFQDITIRKQAEQALRESREQYRQIIEHASDIIYKTDADGQFTFVNPSIIKTLKYTAEEFTGFDYLKVVHPKHRHSVRRFYARQLLRKIPDTYNEFIAIAKDGTEVWLGQHAQLIVKDDQVTGFQAISRDITEKKQTEDNLRHLSLTDELTGLYNQRGFLALAEHQLKLALNKRIEKKLLVLYVDLDNLKQINDRFGHNEGSRAIIETGEILRRSFRHSDLIARLGGDEFVVLAIEANEENTEMIVSRLQANLDEYNRRENQLYELSFSFGVARFETELEFRIENLISRADQEMYKRKKSKQARNYNLKITDCKEDFYV